MSKNTGTSELINYFDLGANGDVGIAGSLDVNTIANATTDTDKFLVSDTGIIKYRTGAELLSDIGAAPAVAGGYVPYTGATTNVDLGIYNITAHTIRATGSANNAGQINLRSDAIFSLVNGYGTIGSGTTNQFNFYQTTGAGVFRGAIFSLNSITASATRTFTLPDADGTIALTSSLSGYLPLTGGTLTGALIGTSASFSGFVGVNGSPATAIPLEAYINSSTAYTTSSRGNVFRVFNTTTSTNTFAGIEFAIEGNANAAVAGINGIWTGSGSAALSFYTRDASTFGEKMRITSGGNVLIGTTTDSGGKLRVDGDIFINNTSNAQIGFNTTSALNTAGAYQYFNRSSVNKWTAGMGPADGSDNYQIVTGGVKALQLTVTTGAATFSSSVSIPSISGLILGQTAVTDGIISSVSSTVGLNFKIGTTSALYINGSATPDVGIGTTNPAGQLSGTKGLSIVNATNAALGLSNGTNHWLNYLSGTTYRIWNNSVAEVMTLTYGGNVLIGTTTNDGAKLRVEGGEVRVTTSNSGVALYQNSGVGEIAAYNWGGGAYIPLVHVGSEHRFNTSTTERMRITSSGSVGIGKTGSINQVDIYYASGDLVNARTGQGQGNATSLFTGWSGASPTTSGSLVFNVTSNGNVTNTNNSYGSLSDIVLKENIVDTTSKLADLLKVKIRNYNLIGTDKKQIGVIAQELETIFPSMIETNSEGLKSVKYSVFVPMLIKAIQEQQQQIDKLKNL